MAASQLADLFKKVLDKSATASERAALETLLLDPAHEADFKILLAEAFAGVQEEVKMEDDAAAQILEVIRSLDHKSSDAPVIAITRKRFRWRIVAAAVAVFLVAAGGWLLFPASTAEKQTQTMVTASPDIAAPVTSQAVLTLSSGEKIVLDHLGAGKLAAEKGVQIAKQADGSIVYGGAHQKVVFNTLSLPRGSRPLQLVLADGTVAWLNAASSITYPTAFTGQNRQVQMEGEAYFEVMHDPSKPFVVQSGAARVEVLGTHFNVKGYTDELSTDITLMEGSVRVTRKDRENAAVLLQPGQQAVVTDGIQLVRDADTEAALAWKNGYFSLRGADLSSIMRQIARWYDVEVDYRGKFPDIKFVGSLSREISLNDLLQSLKEYGIEGRLEQQKLVLQMKEN